jgi:metal-responsive CopG/Arc/MetJ family transcriptional regulator
MARPKVNEPKQQFTVMLKPSLVEEIDKFAEKAELSRSHLMANLIEMGLEDVKILDKMGLIDAVKAGKKIINSLTKGYKVKKV